MAPLSTCSHTAPASKSIEYLQISQPWGLRADCSESALEAVTSPDLHEVLTEWLRTPQVPTVRGLESVSTKPIDSSR